MLSTGLTGVVEKLRQKIVHGPGVPKKVVTRHSVLHFVQNGSAATTNASEQPKIEEKLENIDAIATRRG